MLKSVKVNREKKEITLTLDFDEEGELSASGRNRVVASTHGNQPTAELIQGQPMICGVNCYFKPPKK